MKILFLGTGAADWCAEDKNKAEYRRFSSILIDKNLLIDPGPHIFDFEESFGYNSLYEKAENILLTHSHSDHLDADTLQKLCNGKQRSIWCEKGAQCMVSKISSLNICDLPLFTPIKSGSYTVTALPANHKSAIPEEMPVHLIIEKDGKRIFYGCDGAWFIQETWWYMEKLAFDLIILDGTLGYTEGDCRIFGHNNLYMAEIISESIRKNGILNENGRIFISHLSRDAHKAHKEVVKRLSPSGIEVAYDNLEIEIKKSF